MRYVRAVRRVEVTDGFGDEKRERDFGTWVHGEDMMGSKWGGLGIALFVGEIERERETERDRERQRETERDRERQRESERGRVKGTEPPWPELEHGYALRRRRMIVLDDGTGRTDWT